MFRIATGLVLPVVLVILVVASGCATSSESAEPDKMTSHVGQYSPPPSGLQMKRAGVPAFLDASKPQRRASENLGALAADQLTTLLLNTDRFDVIERAQLEKLLAEQDLEGIVDPNELALPGKVRGVDYLMIGKITNFRVKAEKTRTGMGLAKVSDLVGGVDIKNEKTRITVDVGVDLRLVDPTTGSLLAADFGEYKRTDSLGALGVEILGARATAEGDLDIDEDNQGKILRLALDHCIRRMLPKMDKALLRKQRAAPADR